MSQVVAEITTEVVTASVTEEKVSAEVTVETVEVFAGEAVVMAAAMTRNVISVTNGQTVLTLTDSPVRPSATEMMINGVQASYGIDFIIDNNILTWTGDYELESDDVVEVFFQ